MFQMIKNYIDKMSIDDIDNLAKKNDIYLSKDELEYSYKFIKRNYEALYANPNINLNKFRNHYSPENFDKIVKRINELKDKYNI